MKTKVTVLTENTVTTPSLTAEPGLSLWVEAGDVRLLFDTGNLGAALIPNAQALGIDLSTATHVAFSHNHFDHCGGFFAFYDRFHPTVPIYAHRGFFTVKYWDHSADGDLAEPTYQLVGPAISPTDFVKNGVHSFRQIQSEVFPLGDGGVYLMGGFPAPTGPEAVHPASVMEGRTGIVRDTFPDEQAVAVDTPSGILLLTGCAHSGVVNMVKTVEQRLKRPVTAVVGGTHLITEEPERIAFAAEFFARHENIQVLGACHCTGEKGIEALSACPAYRPIGAGSVLTF